MKWNIFVDGEALVWPEPPPHSADEVEPGVYSILYKGRSFQVITTPTGDGLSVTVQGRSFLVEVADPRDFSGRAQAQAGSGRHDLKSPMPGKVIRVLIAAGDQVSAGQGLVVVEAMKMQNEMKASRDGTVIKVSVQPGDTVGAGDTLVTIE
jgi:biotin carboxyl carrier protein